MKASLGIGKSLLALFLYIYIYIYVVLHAFSFHSSRKAELRWYLNSYLLP